MRVHLSSSFLSASLGGATLDLDLSAAPLSRRISRLHATIRFDVLVGRWELQVRGRNGVELDQGTLAGPELLLPSPSWLPLPPSLSFRMPFANLVFELKNYVPLDEERTEKHGD
jgi:hypothetical protein